MHVKEHSRNFKAFYVVSKLPYLYSIHVLVVHFLWPPLYARERERIVFLLSSVPQSLHHFVLEVHTCYRKSQNMTLCASENFIFGSSAVLTYVCTTGKEHVKWGHKHVHNL